MPECRAAVRALSPVLKSDIVRAVKRLRTEIAAEETIRFVLLQKYPFGDIFALL